ncbi:MULTISPECIES: rhodanese-like domain-containing protein [Enterocloster]|mgnify:CR=1 FL=1|uniref:Rhodanese-related sulfurtransferase n=1 Tax=Enterocloster lavalensis TaxID=460384 RepID=A0A1I0DHL3_9FIRM|nr:MULTISPECIES: rhodanese-like domain-containing protein [Enterocloster]MDR3756835.1 rhodanese-like domain-containing protein [Enterocloster sp.]SET31882.1 Rhodanese-related sulfurtransferase [Enterocloster lavalensis]
MKIKNLLYAGLIAVFALTGCARSGAASAAQTSASQTTAAPTAKSKNKTADSPDSGSSSASGTAGSATGQAQAVTADPQGVYHKITAEEAKTMIDNGGVTIVDVRRPDEYAAQHIPGAINVPNEDISSDPPAALPDMDAVLLVHCRTGIRSKAASDKLIQMGYQNVYDFGGIVDWPYETE